MVIEDLMQVRQLGDVGRWRWSGWWWRWGQLCKTNPISWFLGLIMGIGRKNKAKRSQFLGIRVAR